MLKRQAQWQKTRQSLSWPDKIRAAERVLESVRQWRTILNPVIRRLVARLRNDPDSM